MGDEIPKYLYHYTSITTLALLLKSKKIRFNSLDKVDDLEEALTKDLGNFGKYFFVSCWTDDNEESIPFWHMYTGNMKGVRIKLPSFPFEEYVIPKGLYSQNDMPTYFNPDNYFKSEYLIGHPFIDILKKVEYTNDTSLLYPKIYTKTENYEEFKTNNVGKYKRTHWSFQSEWRYMFIIYPGSFEEFKNNDDQFVEKIKSGIDLPITDYYLNIDSEAFKDMEITLGPNTSEGEKIIVESLISQYNPSARIFNSSLSGKIRK